MSQNVPEFNPYAAPSAPEPGFVPQLPGALIQNIKDFRSQIHAVAGAWIFFGVLTLGLAMLFANFFPGFNNPSVGSNSVAILSLTALLIAISVAWLVCGIGTAYKQLWAIYAGLALSYLSLAGNLFQVNVCGLVILGIIIYQTHRALALGSMIRRAGYPLGIRPNEIKDPVQFS